MLVQFCNNLSDKNTLSKEIRGGYSVEFECKGPVSLYDPLIEVQTSADLTQYDYAIISDWRRKYFVDPHNVKAIGANRFEVQLVCDSLSTFADQIKGVNCVIDRTEGSGGSPYLPSEVFVANCKHKTDILPFTGGLSDSGAFILITAGG